MKTKLELELSVCVLSINDKHYRNGNCENIYTCSNFSNTLLFHNSMNFSTGEKNKGTNDGNKKEKHVQTLFGKF